MYDVMIIIPLLEISHRPMLKLADDEREREAWPGLEGAGGKMDVSAGLAGRGGDG